MGTRIEGPRSTRVRFSTGRAAELRAVPNFRAMQRDGLADSHDIDDLKSVLRGEIPASMLDPLFEEALIRHLFIDPAIHDGGLGVLDEIEVQEAIALAIGAYIEQQSTAVRAAVPADEDGVDEEEDIAGDLLPPAVSEEDLIAEAEDSLPPSETLPESPQPDLGAE